MRVELVLFFCDAGLVERFPVGRLEYRSHIRVRDINGRLVAWFILGLFPGIFDVGVDGGSVSAWRERTGLA